MFFEKHMLPLAFKQSISQEPEIRMLLFFSITATIIQFLIFKRMYPFPNFLPDSYSYLEAAHLNVDINMWPVGYSKFLRFLSVFNYTGQGLFFTQYVLLQASIIFFILTIRYLLNPGKWAICILAPLLILNPLWLYISDFVSSDALFAALSLLWLSTLCWILYLPGKDLVFIHGLILFFVFSVRYNAMYYPIISGVVILLSRAKIQIRIFRLAFVCVPVLIFIAYTVSLYQTKSKILQFSPFGGWQLASNAMYMYAHVAPKSPGRVPASLKNLHELTVHHMDSLRHVDEKFRPDLLLGTYYLWDVKAPLKSYLMKNYSKDSITDYLTKWAKLGPLFGKYGTWLIKNYPGEFIQYYLLPNFINYYSPPVEFLGVYNMQTDSVDQAAIQWFKYKTNKVHGFSKNKEISATAIFPTLLAVINVLFLTGIIGFLFLGGFRWLTSFQNRILVLLSIIWIFNLGFSVFASPIVLRYQIFPMIFTTAFAVLVLNYIIGIALASPKIDDIKLNEVASSV